MQDFTAKRNALFACLDDASKELKGTHLDQNCTDSRTIQELRRTAEGDTELKYRNGDNFRLLESRPDRTLMRMRGKESIFKKPELPIGRCLKPRKTPDYQLNPHKWKKYSLSEVDISDKTNTAAAFAFLKQIDDQREETYSTDTSDARIEFKRSSKIRRSFKTTAADEVPDVEVDKPKLKGSKLVMPEYVIGQTKQQKKRKHGCVQVRKEAAAQLVASKLTLAHLQEEDEGDQYDT